MANEGGRGFSAIDEKKQQETGRKSGEQSHGGRTSPESGRTGSEGGRADRESNLSSEDRARGGERSANEQKRGEQGQFESNE